MIALSRLGFEVTGFDVSSELVQAGCRNLQGAGVRADLRVAPPCRAPEEIGIYDGLVIGRGAYHHIPGRERQIAFLSDCRKHLSQNSPVLIGDFQARQAGAARPRRRFEAGDSISDSFFHRFTEGEVAAEMAEAGFDLVEYRPVPDSTLAQAIGKAR